MTDDPPQDAPTTDDRETPSDVTARGSPVGRRALIGTVGTGLAAFAGCLGGGSGSGDDGTSDADGTDGGTNDTSGDEDGRAAEGDGSTDVEDGDGASSGDGTDGDGNTDDGSDGTGSDGDGEDGSDTDGNDGNGEVVHALPFEDSLDDLEALHESSDLEELVLDTTNSSNFARPEAAETDVDESRLNRTVTSEASIVYRFESPIEGFRAETHYHDTEGGEVSVATSADGTDWTPFDPDRTLYSEAHNDEETPGHWWENYECSADAVDGDPVFLRVTLSSAVSWSPQLGHVEVW